MIHKIHPSYCVGKDLPSGMVHFIYMGNFDEPPRSDFIKWLFDVFDDRCKCSYQTFNPDQPGTLVFSACPDDFILIKLAF